VHHINSLLKSKVGFGLRETIMKHRSYVLALTLTMAGSIATAQMQPGMGGQQPGGKGQPPGQHIPGMGEPGMGGSSQMPGQDQQQNRTKETNTPKVDDDTLMRQVHEQFARSIEFNDVKTSVKDGVVTLEGSVPRKQDRTQAKQMAESVPGVRKVKEKLTVRADGGSASASAGVGTVGGVSATGSANPEPSSDNAGPGNTAAASGTTAGTASMSQAGASASSAPSTNPGTMPGSNAGRTAGPTGETAGTTLPDNASLQGQLQAAFKNDANLRNDHIATNVTDDTIELTGTVASGKERQSAKAIAESYAGNRKVVDHLTVK
jgi:osmotically-inducible protein OsmY